MAFRAQCGCLVWLRLLPHAAFLVLVSDLYAVLAAQNACLQTRDSSEPAAFLGAVALHTCTPHAPQRWHTSSDATAAYQRRSDAVLMRSTSPAAAHPRCVCMRCRNTWAQSQSQRTRGPGLRRQRQWCQIP